MFAEGLTRNDSQGVRSPESSWQLTRAEAIHGLPLSGLGADLSWVAGKRHFEDVSPGRVARTKIQDLQGLPMAGSGADIALAGGRRQVSPEATRSTGGRRTRPELLAGLPVVDISLAGGRRMYHGAATRAGSAPPPATNA